MIACLIRYRNHLRAVAMSEKELQERLKPKVAKATAAEDAPPATSSVELKVWLDGKPSRKALYDKAKELGFSGNLKGLRQVANLQGADADLQLSKMGAENLTALLLFKANELEQRERAAAAAGPRAPVTGPVGAPAPLAPVPMDVDTAGGAQVAGGGQGAGRRTATASATALSAATAAAVAAALAVAAPAPAPAAVAVAGAGAGAGAGTAAGTAIDLNSLTVFELKERLRAAREPVGGRKDELISRLQAHLAQVAAAGQWVAAVPAVMPPLATGPPPLPTPGQPPVPPRPAPAPTMPRRLVRLDDSSDDDSPGPTANAIPAPAMAIALAIAAAPGVVVNGGSGGGDDVDLSSLTIKQLHQILEACKLPVSGNKGEKLDRLKDAAAAPDPTPKSLAARAAVAAAAASLAHAATTAAVCAIPGADVPAAAVGVGDATKLKDPGLRQLWAALELQSSPEEQAVLLPVWAPLSGCALAALALGSHTESYHRELERARTQLTHRQRQRFGERWLAIARNAVILRLAYVSALAVTHVEIMRTSLAARLAAATDPNVRAALQSKIDVLVERRDVMEVEALKLKGWLDEASMQSGIIKASLSQAVQQAAGGADGAAATDAPDADDTAARAFPSLKLMYGGPGLLHLIKFGLLGVVFKVYFTPLIHHVGHKVLGRKHITAGISNYPACDNLYSRINDILMALLIEAHQAHPMFVNAKASLTTIKAYTDNFLMWYRAGLDSGDVPFVFYSNFVFGIGALYRMGKQAISMRDALMCYALLLPAMGLFKTTAKHNLCLQSFLSLCALYSVPEEVAKAMLANVTQAMSDRAFHALATDELLEVLQGFVKRATGKKWDVANAEIHTALNFWFNEVRDSMQAVSSGKNEDESERRRRTHTLHTRTLHTHTPPLLSPPRSSAAPKGKHIKDAKMDTNRGADALRRFELFCYDKKRASLADMPAGLIPTGYEPPAAYVQTEAGGMINFARPLSSTSTPALAKAAAVAHDYLQRVGVLDGLADGPQEAREAQDGGDEEEEAAQAHDGHCGFCAARATLEACSTCSVCGIAACSACMLPTAIVCHVCEECVTDVE